MKIAIENGTPVIDMGDWKLRLTKLSTGELDLNLVGTKGMPCMSVIPQSGNVIRIKPDA